MNLILEDLRTLHRLLCERRARLVNPVFSDHHSEEVKRLDEIATRLVKDIVDEETR